MYKRKQDESSFCMLVALPCGRDTEDLQKQTNALKNKFIDYLHDKGVAGIINLDQSTNSDDGQVSVLFQVSTFIYFIFYFNQTRSI